MMPLELLSTVRTSQTGPPHSVDQPEGHVGHCKDYRGEEGGVSV